MESMQAFSWTSGDRGARQPKAGCREGICTASPTRCARLYRAAKQPREAQSCVPTTNNAVGPISETNARAAVLRSARPGQWFALGSSQPKSCRDSPEDVIKLGIDLQRLRVRWGIGRKFREEAPKRLFYATRDGDGCPFAEQLRQAQDVQAMLPDAV